MLFAQDEPTLIGQIVSGYLMLLLTASLMGWFWLANQRQRTGYLLEQRKQPLPPWGFGELVLIIFLWLASQAGGLKLASLIGGFEIEAGGFDSLDSQQRALLIGMPALLQWVALAIFFVWLRAGVGASWRDIGLTRDLLVNDIKIGLFAFILLVPPIMTLQAGLTVLFPGEQHPFIEMVNDGIDPSLMGAIFFSAVVTAPWFEEVMFRLIMLGWLERFFAAFELETPEPAPDDAKPNTEFHDPFAEDPDKPIPPPMAAWRPVPIIISSFLFAAVHLGHGPAPISLFFFALGLGYVYQRTRRLLPCVIVHSLLNGQTTGMLFLLSGSEIPTPS